MPIANIQDAHEVERGLQTILIAHDADGRAREIRKLFVETLDFDHADVLVTLGAAKDPNLPPDARLLARRGGFSVLYISLDNADDSRVKTSTASEAAKVIGDQIAEEPLLLFTNRDCDELHIIYPDLSGSRPRLQRMVAHRGQPGRTIVQQIANLWHDYGVSGKTMGEAVRNAFSVQPVTDAFFRDYKAAYDDAVSLIAANIERVDAEQFTQTLFNRLLFVHFVSRKGWLKFNGDTDYLNALWQDYKASPSSTNFYRERLRTLFFDGLNNPQSPDPTSRVQPLIGEVPFLNGGLFDETDLDRRAVNAVPDDAIAPLLTDLFNRYNFTVMEATPLDTEVAVDPEMLGKLFEETVNERHSNGAYYTPRPVVSFMCREAIKGYLGGKNIGGLTDAKIANLVDDADPQAITVTQALEIANGVASLKAVDPACGSGAFLLGMMQEILALNATLFQAGKTPESMYQQKLDIITHNVYGVDKDGLAVGTAMLRLWLSLAVDYDGDALPDPLPNLDLKLVVGDAIVGLDPDSAALNQDWFRVYAEQSGLQQDIAAYTTAYGQQKETLKQQVDDTKAQLRNSLRGAAPSGAVEWRIDFADVMFNGGFDVAISNPPYVRYQNIGSTLPSLKILYQGKAAGTSDLYCYFYIRGLQLLKPSGIHVFVCSNSWLDVAYGVVLQDYLSKNSHVQAIFQSAVERQFSTALVNTLISVIKKCDPHQRQATKFVSFQHDFENSVSNPNNRQETHLSRGQLQDLYQGKRFEGYKWGAKQLRVPEICRVVLNRAPSRFVKVGDLATIRLGITTGANEFFYVCEDKIRKFGLESRFLQPVLTSPRDIANAARKITLAPSDLTKRAFVCHDKMEDLAGTAALDYILWGQAQGYDRGKFCASRSVWYDLGVNPKMPLAMNELIDTTAHVFHSNGEILFDKNFIILQSEEAYTVPLCAAMNSTFFQLVVHSSARENLGGGAVRIATHELANLLVVHPDFIDGVDRTMFDSVGWDVRNLSQTRRCLDNALFDALALTSGEQDAVYEATLGLLENRAKKARSK